MKRISRSVVQRGLTLVELMVTLAMLVVVLTVSVPSLARIQGSYQLRTGAHRLLAAIGMARAEALQRVQTVSLCPSAGMDRCGGSFRDGWMLFVDADSNGVLDPSRDILITQAHGLPAGYHVTDRNGSRPATRSITYRPDGSSRRNQTLLLCGAARQGIEPYSIVLSMAGRARVARGEGRCPAE